MDSVSWNRAKDLFERAVDLDTGERDAFLVTECEDDTGMLRRVRSMLEHDEGEGEFDPPERGTLLGVGTIERGRVIGPYEVERVIGSGGMGSVYLARRADETFDKRVAIKVIKRGMDTDEILRRFRTERQVLANLEHPGIARLLDGGATSDGRPYVVMEYVEGRPIDQYCADESLSIERRIALFRDVCAAVDHAHANRVVHRDLKPSNMLVTKDGTVKLLDFGIAKVLEPTDPADTGAHTTTGQRFMTPEYASPEQVLGLPSSEASDVYSLGAVLYELLTGMRPYSLESRTPAAIEQVVCHEQPPRPSVAVTRDAVDPRATTDRASTRTLRSRLSGDLDTITLKALRKEPERRYPSARALSEDLERHLAGRPVLAQPDTWRYRCAKFVRRNRALVATSIAMFVAVGLGLVVSTVLLIRAETARAAGLYREYGAQIAAAVGALEAKDAAAARAHLEAAPEVHRGWEWDHLSARADRSKATLIGHSRGVYRLSFSESGDRLVSLGRGIEGIVWDVDEQREVARWEHDGRREFELLRPATEVILREDRGTVVSARGYAMAKEFDLATGAEVAEWGDVITSVAIDEDLDRIVTGHGRGLIFLRSLSGAERDRRLERRPARVAGVALRNGGTELVALVANGDVHVEDLAGEKETRVHDVAEEGRGFSADPDRRRIAFGGGRGELVVWDVDEERVVLRTDAHSDIIEGTHWHPSGRYVATGSSDRTVAVWDVETGKRVASFLGHASEVTDIAFHPDGRMLASSSRDGTVRLWDMLEDDVRTTRDATAIGSGIAISPDGTRVLTASCVLRRDLGSRLVEVVLRDVVNDTEIGRWEGDEVWLRFLMGTAFDASGSRFAASLGNGVGVWDAETLETIFERPKVEDPNEDDLVYPNEVRDVVFLDDEDAILVITPMVIEVWHPATGELLRSRRRESQEGFRGIALSPDGRRFVTAAGLRATVREVSTLAPVMDLVGHEQLVRKVRWSPDGRRIATASLDGTARLYDASTGECEAVLAGHTERVLDLAFSPDGERLVTSSRDATIRLWDVERGALVCSLRGHGSEVSAVDFSPDGRWIVSKGTTGDVKYWDTGD